MRFYIPDLLFLIGQPIQNDLDDSMKRTLKASLKSRLCACIYKFLKHELNHNNISNPLDGLFKMIIIKCHS